MFAIVAKPGSGGLFRLVLRADCTAYAVLCLLWSCSKARNYIHQLTSLPVNWLLTEQKI